MGMTDDSENGQTDRQTDRTVRQDICGVMVMGVLMIGVATCACGMAVVTVDNGQVAFVARAGAGWDLFSGSILYVVPNSLLPAFPTNSLYLPLLVVPASCIVHFLCPCPWQRLPLHSSL